jgi:MoaA/NifB/PqqE/SkfB family radical SAM enzyme
MDKDLSTYCPLPFNHLHVTQTGDLKPCCQAEEFNDVNLKKLSVEEAWNHQEIQDLRMDMQSGKRNVLCNYCYSKEDSGAFSPRNMHLGEHPMRVGADKTQIFTDNGELPVNFLTIDIRFSNLCNFKCVMCGPDASSLHNKGKVIKIRDNFVEELLPYINEIEHVYFAGGEPLIMDEHYELLNFLVEHRPQVRIVYSTNLSVLEQGKYKVLDMWSKLDKPVFLAVSIDGLFDKGESIRVGLNTKKFINNIHRLKTVDKVEYGLHYTVGSHNIYNIYEFIDQVIEYDLADPATQLDFSNTVFWPEEYSLQNLSDKQKKDIKNYLLGEPYKTLPDRIKLAIDELIKFNLSL